MNKTVITSLWDGVRLTPTQRRIARYLAANAVTAAALSAAELAELAGVSQPSVTRFAMALGHEGYPALRRRLRELAGSTPNGGDAPNPMQAAIAAEQRNLARLSESLGDPGAVGEAAAMLAGSAPMMVLGQRAAAPLAGYVGYFASKVHPDVRVLDGGGSVLGDQLEQARAAGASAMLACVLPRYPRESIEALAWARQLGISVVALTDSPVSPAAEFAEVTLTAPIGTDLVFDLHTAPLALSMVLLQAICDAAPARAQARLEAFDASAVRRQIFVA